ncbi:MAG: hypothetical protein KHY27_00160 [Butyricicoccus pullicaecorum]|nr:hypothetical protein [Butyricicoccus pullicaecorum]
MAKAFAFITNTTAQTLTSGATVNPGTAQHGFGSCGCNCGYIIHVNNTGINLQSPGYYKIDVGAAASDTAAADVTLSLYQDGILVAQGIETIAAANDPSNIAFPAGVKVSCASTLTLVATATAGSPIINGLYITVEKL